MFDTNCVSSIKAEIQRQLNDGKVSVTRKTVINALKLGIDSSGVESAEIAEAAELGISVMFKMGLLPEFRTLQKLGIKPAEYVSKRAQNDDEPKIRTRKKKGGSVSASGNEAAAEPTSPAEDEPESQPEVAEAQTES